MSPKEAAFLAAEKSTARLPQCEQKDHEHLVQTPGLTHVDIPTVREF